MDRTNICKNIIQSIKDYIMDPVKLEPHRAEKHFVRKRKLTLLHVIIYLLYSSKASMFQNLSASGMIFLLFHSLTFPNRLFPKHANLLILLFSRNSIIFQLTCFTSRSLPENYGMVIISLL